MGLLCLDGRARLVELNARARQLLGERVSVGDWLPGAVRATDRLRLERVIHGGETARIEVGLADDGSGAPLTLDIEVCSHDSGPDGVLLALTDVTGQRAAEALRLAQAQAEAASRAKTEFLARMSHELRTPLNAVLGFAELLLLDPAVRQSASAGEQAQHIQNAGKHLLALVDEVLDLSSIESQGLRLRPEPVDAERMVAECLTLVGPLAARQGVLLETSRSDCGGPLGCRVQADRTRLRQVMANLLTNAVKYNRPGGRVGVDLRQAHDGIEIVVRDTGHGMSAQQIAHLFEPFNRLGREGSDVEGTGLGLFITRRLVHAMGGRLTAHSERDVGSSFVVALPRAAAGTEPEPEPSPPAAAGTAGDAATLAPAGAGAAPPVMAASEAPWVVYVEDNRANAVLMRHIFAHRPQIRLEVCTDAESGWQTICRLRPQVVLMDVSLGTADGLEIVQRIRRHPDLQHTACVAVSGNVLPAEVERARAAGCVQYLTKPVKATAVLAVVEGLLARQGGEPPD